MVTTPLFYLFKSCCCCNRFIVVVLTVLFCLFVALKTFWHGCCGVAAHS